MALLRTLSTSPTAIQQRLSATNNFGGVLPVGAATPDVGNAVYKYAEGAVGGLFLWGIREPVVIDQVLVNLGASGTVTVSVANVDPATAVGAAPTYALIAGEEYVVATAAAVTFLALPGLGLTLLPFQALRIVTSGSAAAKAALCVARLERGRQY